MRLSPEAFDEFMKQSKLKQKQMDQEQLEKTRHFQTNFSTIKPELQILKGTVNHESAAKI